MFASVRSGATTPSACSTRRTSCMKRLTATSDVCTRKMVCAASEASGRALGRSAKRSSVELAPEAPLFWAK